MDYQLLLKLAVNAALKAGEEILRIYNTDFDVETKSDNTPVTIADKASGKCIDAILAQSGIPVISEEEDIQNYSIRKNWKQVWIVDPLDGTKEYIKRNGEFAVNIALVENGSPSIGVIYVPVNKEIYFACKNEGSYKITQHDLISELTKKNIADYLFEFGRKLPLQKPPKSYTLVASRSHLSREVKDRVAHLKSLYGQIDIISVGSSIKQCWVAEGKAHEYPRFGTTMEWDTAAGQCILEQAGSKLVDYETGQPMVYNKADMKNSYFIAKYSA
ncbi:MAG: 3'(2'),5'-bisphosphate nucleotidase CysQ [Bacteroidia bacterium]|nr:3'(2'),5'-bisphosphate nucleotidase CysQ [Bacteroidia bacterium]